MVLQAAFSVMARYARPVVCVSLVYTSRKYARNAAAATHMSGRTFLRLPVTAATMT